MSLDLTMQKLKLVATVTFRKPVQAKRFTWTVLELTFFKGELNLVV